MKNCTVFLFLLLFFSQCNFVKEPPLPGGSGYGQKQTGNANPPSEDNRTISSTDLNFDKQVVTSGEFSKKKIDRRKRPVQPEIQRTTTFKVDTTIINRLNWLRSSGIEPDFNEPLSREFLTTPIENQQFPSMITLSRESFLKINFDNDILDYTDRFYTNGIKIDLIAPGLQMNPLAKLMIPYWGSGKNYHGITLVQNMYTPSTTKTGGILYGDRPYAAYLYIGTFKITNDPAHNFRQTSELDLGIIGPNSYGEWVQSSFHKTVPSNNEPLGWEYQVQNDLVLNYTISYEKGIISQKNLDFNLISVGNAGTLYTNLSGGIQIRTGWMNPYFANLGISKKSILREQGLRKFQLFFFLKGSGKLVGYDATLQGGLFNRSSSYTIPAGDISRVLFQGSGGISITSGGFRLDVEQFMLSPDFHNGWWHKWVHLALSFCL